MGATREFTFIVGPETPTLPTATSPTTPTDVVTLGYADAHYTQGKQSVADLTALKAITNSGTSARVNGDVALVRSTGILYRFDSASAEAGDDDIVVTPTTGTGRWKKCGHNPQNDIKLTSTTQSTSKDTGALILEGGLGVEKNVYVGGNLEVTGDMTIQGTTTTVNTATLDVEDTNITVNNGGNNASAEGAGLTVERTGTNGSLIYEDALASKWKAGAAGSEIEVGNVSSSQTFTNKTMDNNANTLFSTNASAGNRTVSASTTVTHPFLEVQNGHTYTLNGYLFCPGGITLTGTGAVTVNSGGKLYLN